jgi:hypothetical protein
LIENYLSEIGAQWSAGTDARGCFILPHLLTHCLNQAASS